MQPIRLERPEPFRWQAKLLNLQFETLALCLGRRAGKSNLLARFLMEHPKGILAGYDCALFAPDFELAERTGRELMSMYGTILRRQGKPAGYICTLNNKLIEVKTLHDMSANKAGRGAGFGVVVFDECAYVRYLYNAWQLSIQPTLATTGGVAIFCSTPKGIQNEFFKVWKMADKRFQGPTELNPSPHVRQFLEKRRQDLRRGRMSQKAFDQELRGLFVDIDDSFVRMTDIRYFPDGYNFDRDIWRIHLGGDFAARKPSERNADPDWTAFVVAARHRSTGEIYVCDAVRGRFDQMHEIDQQLIRLVLRWRPSVLALESISFQSLIGNELRKKHPDWYIKEMQPGKEKKTARFAPTADLYRMGLMYHPDFLDFSQEPKNPEQEDLERDRTRRHNMLEFQDEVLLFPNAEHDDFADALAYCVVSFGTDWDADGNPGKVWDQDPQSPFGEGGKKLRYRVA